MNDTLKKRAVHELKEYALNSIYLACMFGVMTWHRRLLLLTYGIHYTDYGVAVIEALILGKVIMIGNLMHLGRRFEDQALIVPTLYKTVVFTIYVAAFTFAEETVKGLLRGEDWAGGVRHFREMGMALFLAQVLVVFVTFIPFFGIKELSRVLGEGKIRRLLFRRRPIEGEEPGGSTAAQPAT